MSYVIIEIVNEMIGGPSILLIDSDGRVASLTLRRVFCLTTSSHWDQHKLCNKLSGEARLRTQLYFSQ